MAAMGQTYREARTYADRGLHKTVYVQDGHRREEVLGFETQLSRGKTFRFEYCSRGEHMAIWSDFVHTYSRWNIRPGVEAHANIELALSAATGVSGGTAHLVPWLLLEPDGLRAFGDLAEVHLDGTEIIDEQPCWRIVATRAPHRGPRPPDMPDVRHDPLTLWIDQRTHLLVRVSSRVHFLASPGHPAFDTEETTSYKPSLNAPLRENRDSGACH